MHNKGAGSKALQTVMGLLEAAACAKHAETACSDLLMLKCGAVSL